MTDNLTQLENIQNAAHQLADQSSKLAEMTQNIAPPVATVVNMTGNSDFVSLFTIFILACFVGYYVVWRVTPALHTPLMSVTNAISAIIIVGGVLAVGKTALSLSSVLAMIAIFLASVNIFGGFIVTQRMLSMFQKRR